MRLVLIFIIPIILSGCRMDYITRSDIRHAQKINGMDFDSEEIRTMQEYLNRNRSGYDSMRSDPISYNAVPSMLFNPLPLGFKLPTSSSQVEFDLNVEVEIPQELNDLAYLSVADLSVLIKQRKVSCVELTRLFIDRIKKYDDQLLSVITITEDRAIEQARKLDSELASGKYRGPLHGIPYGVKDLVAVEGYPTTWGSVPYKDQEINSTATIVKKLDSAGAILIAKLVSGALARGDVWFGGQTKNPWDPEQGAGGSSAGSGSATAAGLVAFAIGTETLGSITSPSTKCGITGLRPTYGRVSRNGVMSLSWSMDKVGPMCHTAKDCGIVMDAISGFDDQDVMTFNIPFSFDAFKDLSGLKIGFFKHLFDEDSSDSGENARVILDLVKELGYELEEVGLPKSLSGRAYDIILRAEAGAFFDQLILEDGDELMVQQDQRSRANSLRQSRFIPAVEYLQAQRHRSQLIQDFHEVISGYDAIMTPTFGGNQLMVTNLTGHPVLSIPSGFDKEGRPTSISILGNLFDEESILLLGDRIQNEVDHHLRIPPGFE